MVRKTVLVPPDGNWGWVIMLATALCNIIVIPIIQNFGLIFKDTFKILELSATDSTIIINVNSAFGYLMGLFNGQLMKRFGYRKVALGGSVFVICGVLSTAYANSFKDFIITYSLITSLGMALCVSSFHLALNMYFKKRRNKAMGYAMTITGFGPIIIPQLMSFLMDTYGVKYSVLILGALSMHTIFASLLLQPVKWHMKKEYIDVEDNEESKQLLKNEIEEEPPDKVPQQTGMFIGASVEYIDSASIYGDDIPMRKHSTSSFISAGNRRRSPLSPKPNMSGRKYWSSASINSLDPAITFKPLDNKYQQVPSDNLENHRSLNPVENVQIPNSQEIERSKPENDVETNAQTGQKNVFQRMFTSVVLFFDLDLLTDFEYVNLMLGMSFAIFAEINFSVLTPFILGDMNFTTPQVATFMSIIAGVDIVFRFISPYVGDWLKFSAKVMYMISMVLLIGARSLIVFFTSYDAMLVIAVLLGIAKGVRTVYIVLVIPAYVPLERLAAASGIQTVTNGIILLCLGPFIGVIRDWTGSYNKCIIFINGVTALTLTMWTIGAIVCRHKKKKRASINIK